MAIDYVKLTLAIAIGYFLGALINDVIRTLVARLTH